MTAPMLALFDPADALRMIGVALGIGLVIFVHELGHYLAARYCRVRVEVFSIGFGPALLSWRRGPTLYKLAAIPLGGYVKMAGDEAPPGGRPVPDDHLPAKSVGQRFLIYSGGVLMNMAFALVVFPILFAVGVPFLEPRVDPMPGGPAWHAGVRSGTEVLAVNGNSVYDFTHVPTQVALGDKTGVTLTLVDEEGGAPYELDLVPEFDERFGFYTVGVRPAMDPEQTLEIAPDSPAAKAGLETGDRLLAVESAPPGMRPGDALLQVPLLGSREPNDPIRVEVEGPAGRRWVDVAPEFGDAMSSPRLGISPLRNRITDIRAGSPAESLGLEVDDILVALDGAPIYSEVDLRRAVLAESGAGLLTVSTAGTPRELSLAALSTAEREAFLQGCLLGRDADSNAINVYHGDPGQVAGLRAGDRITAVDGSPVETFEDMATLIGAAGTEGLSVALTVERARAAGGTEQLEIVAAPEARPLPFFGLYPAQARYVFQAASPVEAVKIGVTSSWNLIQDSWLTLKGLLNKEVSSDNVGGIISIGVVSYHFAQSGLVKLFFFLCTLSVTLAFLNVLPIPILDGGHLFFLIIEKLKGGPVSERVHGYSQMVGLVLILSLMVYVTFNDIVRHLIDG